MRVRSPAMQPSSHDRLRTLAARFAAAVLSVSVARNICTRLRLTKSHIAASGTHKRVSPRCRQLVTAFAVSLLVPLGVGLGEVQADPTQGKGPSRHGLAAPARAPAQPDESAALE